MSNTVAILLTARDEASQVIKRLRNNLGGVQGPATSMARGLDAGAAAAGRLRNAAALASEAITRMAAGMASLAGATALVKMADEWAMMQGRLKLATRSQQEYTAALDETFAIAQRTGGNLGATANLYGKLQKAMRGLGKTQQDALGVTEMINQSFAISGTRAAEAASATLQFGQALGSGVLRGDEFNSMMEASPRIMQAIADGMGAPIGALRKMAEEGKLTSEVVVQALLTQKDKLASEFAQMPKTVGQAFENLRSALTRYIGEMDQSAGATRRLAAALDWLARNIDVVAQALGAFLLTLGGAWIARLAGAAGAAGLLSGALALLKRSLVGLGVYAAIEAIGSLGETWQTATRILADGAATERAAQRLREIERLTALVAAGSASAGDEQALAALKAERAWTQFTRALPAAADQVRIVEGVTKTLSEQIGTRLTAALERASGLLDKMGKDADTALKAVQAGYDAQREAVERWLQTKLAALRTGQASERQIILGSADAEREAGDRKLAAARDWAGQSLRITDATYARMADLARAAGQDVAAIDQQGLATRTAVYSQLEQAYRQTIDQMIAEERRLLDAARAADEQRALLKMSVEDRIRALQQRGMDDYAAYQDRLRQTDEKAAAARAALQAGDFDRARQLAEQAMSLAERNAGEVTRTVQQGGRQMSQVLVSEAQASATAIAKIKDAAGIADAALQGVANSNRDAVVTLEKGIAQASGELGQFSRTLGELRAQQSVSITAQVDGNLVEAAAAIRDIQALQGLKSLTLQINSNAAAVRADIEALAQDAANMGGKTHELALKARIDGDALRAGLVALKRELEASGELAPKLPAELDLAKADTALMMLSQQMTAVLGAPRTVVLDKAEAQAALDALKNATQSQHTVNPDTARAQAEIGALQRPTSSTHTVHVRTVQNNATGGPILKLARGGLAPRFRRIFPGRVSGPGTGTSDSVPAMLSAGEYVIKAASVRKYGAAMLNALNAGLLAPVPAFARGGLVSAGAALSTAASTTVTVQMPHDYVRAELTINGQQYRMLGERAEAQRLASALRALSRGA